MRVLLGVVVALTPVAVVAALLALATWRDRRSAARLARQVEVTDAVDRRLGAVVAAHVARGWRGRWRVIVRAPLDRPLVLAAILAAVEEVFGSPGAPGAEACELVLTRAPVSSRRPAPALARVVEAA
jgi:hypothetical protein